MEATAMLQENNNNNYSCLERVCEREAPQEQERGILPFAKLLQMGSFTELADVSHQAPVRGFRAWAMSSVCARTRRWATLSPANPAAFLKRPDAAENQAAGELRPQTGMGLGLQLDASSWNRCCRSRRGTLGALVTVATLKASERGGQTQTQCFLLQAKGRSYLCAAGSRRAPAPSLFTRLTSAPAAHGLGDAASSERPPDSGKRYKQREGKDKPRPVRKWRTSCETAFSVKGRVPWDCEEREVPPPGASPENRSKLASQSSAQDTQTTKQESPDAETFGPATIFTRCREAEDRSAIGLGRVAEDSGQSSGTVEEDELTLPVSGSPACHLDQGPANPEMGCIPKDQERPINAGMHDELQPKSSPQKTGRFQDLLGDKSPRLGASGKSEVIEAVRSAGNSEADLALGAKVLKETGSSPNKDPESNGGAGSRLCTGSVRGGLPCGHVTTEGPLSHGCEDNGLATSTVLRTHRATDSKGECGSLVEVEDIPEQPRQSTLSDGGSGGIGGCKDRPLDDTGIGVGVSTPKLPVESRDRAITDGYRPECVDFSCESRAGASGVEESRLLDVWGGGHRRDQDGPEAEGPSWGDQNRDPTWQPDNSLSRGLDYAATDNRAPPNPAPPGVMATALPSLDGRQDEVSLPSLGDPEQQEGKGGMVAIGQRFLDVEQEGDDDFGLFVQAGEQPSWDEGFTDFQQVPYGTSESAALADPVSESEPAHWTFGQTENPFHQSEDTWTAFSQEGSIALEPGSGGRQHMPSSGGQWWPPQAAEEIRVKPHAPFDLPHVFQEAFPSMPSSCPDQNPVLTLRQLLQGHSCEDSTAGHSGSLLDGLQDVNRIIGLKYKWAESHSQKLLLQSVHLGMNNKGFKCSQSSNPSHMLLSSGSCDKLQSQ